MQLSKTARAMDILFPYRSANEPLLFLGSILAAFDPEQYWHRESTAYPGQPDLTAHLQASEIENVRAGLRRYLQQAEAALGTGDPMSIIPLRSMVRSSLRYRDRFEARFLGHPGHVYGVLSRFFPLFKIARDWEFPVPGYSHVIRRHEFWISFVPECGLADVFLLDYDYVITQVGDFLRANDWRHYDAVCDHSENPPPSRFANEDFRSSVYSFLADVCVRLSLNEFFALSGMIRKKDTDGIKSLLRASDACLRGADGGSFEQFWNHPSMDFFKDLFASWS